MTRGLEETFNIAPVKPIEEPTVPNQIADEISLIKSNIEVVSVVDKQLKDLSSDSSDIEFDDIAKKATETFDELMDLGMNAPVTSAPAIFEAATKLLGHALSAKTAKFDKKLKAAQLELKKLQVMQKKAESGDDESIPGQAQVLDRNEIIKMIKSESK